MKNRRVKYLLFLICTLAVGWIIYRFPHSFPRFILHYGPDTLLAIAVYSVMGIVFPAKRFGALATWTLVICFILAFSRLYRADWLLYIRNTSWGRPILGSPFHWSVLVCYLVGTYLAVSIDGLFIRRKRL